jgi:hypothetical protein
MPQHDDAAAIRSHQRAAIEARLTELLEKTNSAETAEDIKRIIFFSSDIVHPSEYFAQISAFFHPPDDFLVDGSLLSVIQDAWNYFPHLSLEGRSPAEFFTHYTATTVTISRIPELSDVEVDEAKIDEAALALLLLGLHADARVWKGHDWAVLDRLFKKGYITDPARKTKSVTLTTIGSAEAKRLFKKLFGR